MKFSNLFRSKKAITILLCLLILLPLALLRDVTPTEELKYISIADEAIRNGSLFAFTNHGIPYADKPPLFFWWIMLCRWLLGSNFMLLAPFISIIPMIVSVISLNKMMKDAMPESNRELSTLMLLTTTVFMLMGIILRPDMLMTMFICLALQQFCAVEIQGEKKAYHIWLFALFVFLGLFSKGLVGIMMPLCVAICYLIITKHPRRILTFCGWRTLIVILTGCFLWFLGVYLEGGKDYLYNLTIHQTVGRTINSFHHKHPFYYYFIVVWYTMLPWSLLCIFGIINILKRWKETLPLQKFFTVAFLSTFLMLSFSSSKIEIYLLPLMPFAVYLVMSDMSAWRETRWSRWALGIPATARVLLFPATIVYLYLNSCLVWQSYGIIFGAFCTSLMCGFALWNLIKNKTIECSIKLISVSIIGCIIGVSLSLRMVDELTGYETLCNDAHLMSKEMHISNFGAVLIGRSRNMDVYLHSDIKDCSPDTLNSGSIHNIIIMARKKKIKDVRIPKRCLVRESSLGKYLIIAYR